MTFVGAVSRVLKRKLGPFRHRRKELIRTQYFDEFALERYQFQRLREILEYAYRNVPFYTDLFRQLDLHPSHFKCLEDLTKLPILTKHDVRSAGRRLVSSGFHRWMLRTAYTGGTTGAPMRITRDLHSIGNEHAFVRRQWDWAGIGLNDRCAHLTGRLVVSPEKNQGRLYRYDASLKELILSTYHLSDAVIPQYLEAMRAYGVVGLVAYPSAALTLARGCLERNIDLPLRAVLTSSETLNDIAKQIISEAFKCPVFDFYGSAERVCYIHTCEQKTYHIVPEYGITELVPVSNSDSACRIVATGFWNRAMPLIRYDLEDQVVPSKERCSCGRVFPVVQCILGRPSIFLQTPSGRRLGTALLTHLLYGVSNIYESQLVQDAVDHVYMRYVPLPEFSDVDLNILRALVTQHLPSELKVDLVKVDAIARTNSGKFLPILSYLNNSKGPE